MVAAASHQPPHKQSTSNVLPKQHEQWQTPRSAIRHVSWAHQPELTLHNRFGSLADEPSSNDDNASEISESFPNSTPSTQQQRTPQQPKSSFHPNQRPEKQTLPTRPTPRHVTPPSSSSRADKSSAPSILIVGDSMIKQVTSYQIRGKLREHNRNLRPKINVKPFLGARTRSMPLYLKALLQETEKPDIAIVHVGTNDIHTGLSTADIREDFVNLYNYLQKEDIEMFVSLLTCRSDEHKDAIRPINHMLIELCDQLGVGYTGNENIHVNHLNPSGLHLHKGGSELLASNFSNTIIQFC